jgi:carboxylesterase
MKKTLLLMITVAAFCAGCGTIEYQPDWIDSPQTRDPSLSNPAYRVSTRPSALEHPDPDKPVVIAVHGFTACTYEWEEFRTYVESKGAALVSLVLLGGHGTDIEDFKSSTWQDWQKPVIAEYNALQAQGYRHISFAASSMGAALVLEALMNGKIVPDDTLNHLILVDPFIIPTDKNLYMINLASIFVTNVPYTEATDEENRHYYVNRPSSTLIQLKELARKVEDQVKNGYSLPAGVSLTVYKATTDDAADPENAAFLQTHIRDADGNKPDIHMVETDKHVFTRLLGRATVSDKDKELQQKTFAEILRKIAGRQETRFDEKKAP